MSIDEFRAADKPYTTSSVPGVFHRDNMITGGWITMLFVPVVGFTIGAIMTAKNDEVHGIWMMVCSCISALVWWLCINAITSCQGYHC